MVTDDVDLGLVLPRVGINKRCLLIFFGKLTNKRTNERTMKINERRLLIFFLVNVLSVCF